MQFAPISLLSFTIIISYIRESNSIFTNRWAVEIHGSEDDAKRIAQEHGFIYLNKIMPNHYQFTHPRVHKRSVNHSQHRHRQLKESKEVHWLEQQVVKRRTKRDFFPDDQPTDDRNSTSRGHRSDKGKHQSRSKRNTVVRITDPLWSRMWYLNDKHGNDMNVQGAWNRGYTGRGVVVTILDDGIEKNHPDLELNYDPKASTDINGNDDDPQPRYDISNENRHGTRCAGEVSGEANNQICGVGIAFRASIGGVRMLDGDVTDAVEAASLSLNPNHIDIYSASWGPDDDGKTVDGPAKMAKEAFINGITKGRKGKGSIFVWASGNGGKNYDNCNCDGYTSSIFTVSISSATENGNVPWYSESCSSTMATTYSSGQGGEKQVITTDLSLKCTDLHTGTSASAPMAAGIIALTLEANGGLTWRDLQHIIVKTAKPRKLKTDDWITNGVGRNVSHSFGYGMMDAEAMVVEAYNWTNVPKQSICSVTYSGDSVKISQNKRFVQTITTDGCKGTDQTVNYLEHVQVVITLEARHRGQVQLVIISPSGTRSKLLALRKNDYNQDGINSWPFMTTHMWGERATGQWSLEIISGSTWINLSSWTLVVYGTASDPMTGSSEHRPTSLGTRLRGSGGSLSSHSGRTATKDCGDGEYLSADDTCVRYCPDYYYRLTGDLEKERESTTTPQANIQPIYNCGSCPANCITCGMTSTAKLNCSLCSEHYVATTTTEGATCRRLDSIVEPMSRSQSDGVYGYTVAVVIVTSILLFVAIFCVTQMCDKGCYWWRGDDKRKPASMPKDYGKLENNAAAAIKRKLRTPCLYKSNHTSSYIENNTKADNLALLYTDSE